jgi:hypothetical protein
MCCPHVLTPCGDCDVPNCDSHITNLQIFDQKRKLSAPESFLWKLALRLGASCSLDLTPATTHTVTLAPSTEKAIKAIKQGAHVVHPEWLLACETRCTPQPHAATALLHPMHACMLCQIVIPMG